MMKKFILVFLCVISIVCSFPIFLIANATCYSSFSPYFGFCTFVDDEELGYGCAMLLEWNNEGVVEFDSSTDTYEQELIFYNYDGNAFATSNRIYETDLPNSYFDTSLFDPDEEINIAIGTTSPENIIPGEYYNVFMGLDIENETGSMFKVSSQEGRHYLLPSKYFIFAESTFFSVPFKSGHIAPDDDCFWWNEIESNNSTGTANARLQQTWINGTISSSSDVDYYKVYLTGKTTVYFSSAEGYDYDVRIYNEEGTLVDSLASVYQEQTKTFSVDENGYYYFKVFPFAANYVSADAVYRLYVE